MIELIHAGQAFGINSAETNILGWNVEKNIFSPAKFVYDLSTVISSLSQFCFTVCIFLAGGVLIRAVYFDALDEFGRLSQGETNQAESYKDCFH